MVVAYPSPEERAVQAVVRGVEGTLLDPAGPFGAARSPDVRGGRRDDPASFETEIRASPPTEVHVIAPLRCFRLDLDIGAEPPRLDEARDTGWRFLVEADGEAIGVGETYEHADGTPGLALLEPAAPARQLAAALIDAFARYQPASAEYEMRFLRVPDLGAAALWVHGPDAVAYPLRGFGAPQDDRPDLTTAQDPPPRMAIAEMMERLTAASLSIGERLGPDARGLDEPRDDGWSPIGG